MRAIVSGEAGLALVHGAPPTMLSIDCLEPKVAKDGASRLFDGARDICEQVFAGIDEVIAELKTAWAADRVGKLFLLLTDPHEPEGGLREYAECIEELLAAYPASLERARDIFFATALNDAALFDRSTVAATDCEQTLRLLIEVRGVQPVLHDILDAYDRIAVSLFSEPAQKARALTKLKSDGAVRELVELKAVGKNLDFIKLRLLNQFASEKGAISQWFAMMQPGLKRVRIKNDSQYTAADWDEADEAVYKSDHLAFEVVQREQAKIIEALKDRDIARAKSLAEELVLLQRTNSTQEQIAKTLSKLAINAKRQDVPELQTVWAEWSERENPADPKAVGHLVDALIQTNRFTDASEAIERVRAVGGFAYAANSTARILRLQGYPDQARDHYLAVLRDFDGTEEGMYAAYGAADTLRDLGDLEGALSEFETLTQTYTTEASFWIGRASVLMDLGRFDQAFTAFGRGQRGKQAAFAKTGKAAALKLAGRLSEAMALFDEVLEDFPNSQAALCGRAEIFRLGGQYDRAIEAFELARDRSPFVVAPLLGLAGCYAAQSKYKEGFQLLLEARSNFPHEIALSVALARLLRNAGNNLEALKVIDEVLGFQPNNSIAIAIRADLLNRMGQRAAAIESLDHILLSRPHNNSALLMKATILIEARDWVAAERLVAIDNPKSIADWRRYLLFAQLVWLRDGIGPARKMFSRGERCPFARQRGLLKSAWAVAELKAQRPKAALKVVETEPAHIANVVAFHVYAAAHRPGKARLALEAIRQQEQSAQIINLAEEIGRRHGIIEAAPTQTREWVDAAEIEFLLAQAA